jgi:biopolymer transport protein ExbD
MKVASSFDEQEVPEIQMAPMIDCVFLLLIFFLCSAQLKRAHKEVELELPHAAAAIKTKSEADTLIFEVTRDGTVHLDAEALSMRTLHKRVREAVSESPNRRVRLDVDRAAPYIYIVHLVDLLQFYGLNNVGIRARD